MRCEKIQELLVNNDIVSVDRLREELAVSSSTLRRDLLKLQEENRIVLLHGGGVRLAQKTVELGITTKIGLNKSLKDRIARKAASYVENGDVIFLDPSSTTYLMIPYLTDKDITVVTNGVSHINKLVELNISCIMIGGIIKKKTNSCIGPLTEDLLKSFYFSKCFLGASGFTVRSGITNYDVNERSIKILAVKNSHQPYFLMDHTKYGVVTMIKIANLDEYPIITDSVPPELKEYKNFILAEE
jgi:DeoR family fructose operon transcriptional repressor